MQNHRRVINVACAVRVDRRMTHSHLKSTDSTRIRDRSRGLIVATGI